MNKIGLNSVLVLVVGNKFQLNGKVTFFSDPEISSFLPSFLFSFTPPYVEKKQNYIFLDFCFLNYANMLLLCTALHFKMIIPCLKL